MSLLPFVFYNIEKNIIIIQVLNCQCNFLPNISLCCKKKKSLEQHEGDLN